MSNKDIKYLKEAFIEISVSGQGLREKLIEKSFSRPENVDDAIKEHLNSQAIDITSYQIQKDAVSLIPEESARFYNVLPLEIKDEKLIVASVDPTDFGLLRELRLITGKNIDFVISSRTVIQKMIDEVYTEKYTQGNLHERNNKKPKGDRNLRNMVKSPVVRLVNDLIMNAIKRGASDIHFEPFESELKVRYRIDGLLQEVNQIPNAKKAEVLSRIKIMASLDIAEKRRPQDGRIKVDYESKSIDIRVSTLPTGYGEKIVLRILDKSSVSLDLVTLGMDSRKLEDFREVISRPYGMVLVTGPTGSGKTTTLYAALNQIKSPALNISTVEDPIEYHLDGINQTQMKSEIGLTFASALRTLLRQDPNIIMVGEIRDRETADIAVRAALTGHLVFSTLHTNDAPSAITRLMDMGIEPFLISSSVVLIVAQRLVRRICDHCKQEISLSPKISKELGISGTAYAGKGCRKCGETGYKGRIGLYEVLNITEEIKRFVIEKKSAHEIKSQATAEGMTTLRQDGIDKIKAGITTVEEVLRETIYNT